jgi:hypothetical protein
MGGKEPSSNRVVVPARQATQAGGLDTLESIPGFFKSLKIAPLDVVSRRLEEKMNFFNCDISDLCHTKKTWVPIRIREPKFRIWIE